MWCNLYVRIPNRIWIGHLHTHSTVFFLLVFYFIYFPRWSLFRRLLLRETHSWNAAEGPIRIQSDFDFILVGELSFRRAVAFVRKLRSAGIVHVGRLCFHPYSISATRIFGIILLRCRMYVLCLVYYPPLPLPLPYCSIYSPLLRRATWPIELQYVNTINRIVCTHYTPPHNWMRTCAHSERNSCRICLRPYYVGIKHNQFCSNRVPTVHRIRFYWQEIFFFISSFSYT